MILRRYRWVLAGLALGLAAKGAGAVEVNSLYGFELLGGQYFFNGQRGNLGGDVLGYYAPAMKFDENWSLLPSINASYQGTKQVLDVAGAGTLFQQQMDYRGSVTGIYQKPGSLWRLKPTASYKYELLKETNDENWGGGLFDYQKWDVGLGADYVYKDPYAVRMSVDYYKLHFPHYTSLESQAALDFNGQPLARELIGDYVLDTRNVAASVGMDFPMGDKLVLSGGAAAALEMFPNQRIVDASGLLDSPLRQDVVTMVTAGGKYAIEKSSLFRMLASLDAGFTYDSSNQNSYDAVNTVFIPGYYNYWEASLGPSLKFFWGPKDEAIALQLSATGWYRDYPQRPAQDGTGIYLSETVHTTTGVLAANFTYPLVPHLDFLVNVQLGRALSNMQFQQFYAYNYTVENYMFGFRYDF